ncbi:MAG: M4 family metallopeptidase [Lachnospiraceae bacterium]|nr:M4 family metallopeptidase [Lachnospiraceae bacterium]
MKNKKISKLFLVLLIALMLVGCGDDDSSSASSANAGDSIAEQEAENEQDTGSDVEEEIADYTLEDIANLNGCTVGEMNVLMGANDELLFLGEKYGEEIINDEIDAERSLEHLRTLIGLDGIKILFSRKDISPVTKNTIYTFNQVADAEIEGQEITAQFYNSLIKVIVAPDGQLAGVSANIISDDSLSEIDSSEILSKNEAMDFVVSYMGDNVRKIYPEKSVYAFWEDEGTVRQVSAGKTSPAWFIYADADTRVSKGKPYEVYVVSVKKRIYSTYDETDSEPALLTKFYTDTLNNEDTEGVYTSLFFFDGMQDVGDYEYEIDLEWILEIYPDYAGDILTTVKVPVMYSEKEDLYYLGSVEHRITLSNYYDFNYLDTTNAYVTTTPEDKYSWHFQLDKAADGSTEKYFDDPDYVISSFAVMNDIWSQFNDRYGMDSVDNSGLPTILLPYMVDSAEYPKSVDEFPYNAVNLGQIMDWQAMGTSPALGAAIDHGVMGHEYTHGINSQLTSSQYLNGPGAVMESYADIIGSQIAQIYEYPECSNEYAWEFACVYCKPMRSMSNPWEHGQPRTLFGKYYTNETDSSISDTFDNGGVHTNSGILNYLSYCMVEGTDGSAANTLTLSEGLDIWFDTLYYTNYQTDYFDVAHYLLLSAKSMGLSPEKQQYIYDLLVDFSLISSREGENMYLEEETGKKYCFTLHYDTSVFDDLEEAFPIGIYLENEETGYNVGQIYADVNNVFMVDEDIEISDALLFIGNSYDGSEMVHMMLDELYGVSDNIDITYEYYSVAPGDTVTTLDNWELVAGSPGIMDYVVGRYEDGSVSLEATDDGFYFLVIRDNNSSKEQANYKIIQIAVSSYDDMNEDESDEGIEDEDYIDEYDDEEE